MLLTRTFDLFTGYNMRSELPIFVDLHFPTLSPRNSLVDGDRNLCMVIYCHGGGLLAVP